MFLELDEYDLMEGKLLLKIDVLYLKEKTAELMNDWNVPGISIGITDAYGNSEIVSLGKRDIENGKDFNEDTIIPIGCCTKAFTSMALGILTDRKLISLDDLVKKHLNYFTLNTQILTDNVTIKDILSMRTGIHMDEIIYKSSNYSYSDILTKMRYIRPYVGFREYFIYDIFLYNFLKAIIINVANSTWEDFILNEIAYPIGIKNIMFALDYFNNVNFAKGYLQKNEHILKVEKSCNIESVIPSAGIDTSISEILKWMEFLLRDGKCSGKQLISNNSLNDILKPYAFSKARPAYRELFYQSYALGWFNEPYKGNDLFYHEGNVYGYSCLIGILPDMKIGISVLINKNKCPLTRITLYSIIDNLLGIERTDWSKRFKREAIIKNSWHSKCICHDDAVKKTSDMDEGQFSNGVYGTLKIYRMKQNDLFIQILSAEFSFYSIMDGWYVFNNNDDFLFLKYKVPNTSIGVKFAINSKEIEFIKM